MIDKNGKIFGKVSVIDLFIVVVLIAVGAFGIRIAASRGVVANPGASMDTVVVELIAEESASYVAEAIAVGDRIEDEAKGIHLGTITDIKLDKGFVYNPNSDGQLVKSYKEGYYSIMITAEVKGQLFEHGLLVEGNKYPIGQAMTMRWGKGKVYARVCGIEKKVDGH